MKTKSKTLKETAIDFLHLCASGNSREAFSLYASENFRHHNAYFRGDAVTLMEAMEESALQNPDKIFSVQRALEDGDQVAVHSFIRQKPGDRGAAVIHIIRFEAQKVAEMWDFGQEIPENSPNENGMF